MSESGPRTVFFFIPLNEALDIPQVPYELDLDGPIAGSGRVSTTPSSDVPRTRHVSLFPRRARMDDPASVQDFAQLVGVVVSSVPWAFPNQTQQNTGNQQSEDLPTVDRTVIEAAVVMPAAWVAYSATKPDEFDPVLQAALDDALDAVNRLQAR